MTIRRVLVEREDGWYEMEIFKPTDIMIARLPEALGAHPFAASADWDMLNESIDRFMASGVMENTRKIWREYFGQDACPAIISSLALPSLAVLLESIIKNKGGLRKVDEPTADFGPSKT